MLTSEDIREVIRETEKEFYKKYLNDALALLSDSEKEIFLENEKKKVK